MLKENLIYICARKCEVRQSVNCFFVLSGILHHHKRKFVIELHQVCEYLQASGKKVPTINLNHAG